MSRNASANAVFGIISSLKKQTMQGSRKRMWKRKAGSSFNSISSEITSTLADVDEEFLHAAEFGDIPNVKRLIESNTDLNVDCIDALGRTALRLAVKNEHLEVVELLLEKSSSRHIYEAVLQGISAGHIQIAESILKHHRYLEMWKERKKLGDDDHFYNTTHDESQFSPDITPLMLAAHKNQYEIVQLLLLRGEVIHKPHKYSCMCQECINKAKFDMLRSAKYRFNAYKGLSSEAYISLSSKDPILTAFQLANDLKNLAKLEKYFRTEYEELARQLSEYVVKLLGRVRTQQELEKVLNKTDIATSEKYDSLARFKLALRYKEKKFVSHPSCQQHLVSMWYMGMGTWSKASWLVRVAMVIGFVLSYPFTVVLYLIAPNSKFTKILKYPCVKFVCHSLSFFSFLAMIMISSGESTYSASNNHTLRSYATIFETYTNIRTVSGIHWFGENFPMRYTYPTTTQALLSIWILGLLTKEVKLLYGGGISHYVVSWYNLMDYSLLTLYVTAFTLSYAVMFKVHNAMDYLRSLPADDIKNSPHKMALYWLNADRYYWNTWDPINISEGLYALANILSFARISYLLPASEDLGPLQISLGKMVKDIMKFMALFVVVFLAFMIGLQNLYWYYSVRLEIEVEQRDFDVPASESFGNVLASFRTIFWSVFGRGESSVVELGEYDNTFTQDLGYIIYGIYNISIVTVLLNMLIAMMARSFQNITEDSDVEWKFSRSLLYMDYIGEETDVLPVPLNLLSIPRALGRLMFDLCCDGDDNEDESESETPGPLEEQPSSKLNKTSTNSTFVEINNSERAEGTQSLGQRSMSLIDGRVTYQLVMQRIIQRYIFEIQREAEVTEDDFEEIKQDISSFRYEMLNHLSTRETEHQESCATMFSLAKQMMALRKDVNVILETVYRSSNNKREDDTPQGKEKQSKSYSLSSKEKDNAQYNTFKRTQSNKTPHYDVCVTLHEEGEEGN